MIAKNEASSQTGPKCSSAGSVSWSSCVLTRAARSRLEVSMSVCTKRRDKKMQLVKAAGDLTLARSNTGDS